ncbi:phosphatase PAP2 family protein [Marinicella litoralis]|nr:phosphatase PAP2 family protein [Marinicella litoralis]
MTTEWSNPYQNHKAELLLLIIGIYVLITVYWFELDFKIADLIYGQFQWSLKQSFVFEGLLHKFARMLLITIYLGLIYQLIKTILSASDPSMVYHLLILVLAIGSSVLIVTLSKRLLNVDCPWDLIRYGGDKPYFPMFGYDSKYLPSAHCFPASHASVGFSWMALYFYLKVTNNQLKFRVLGMVVFLGFIFGGAQQLRGAHFISHDLWSFLICLTNCMFIYHLAYRKSAVTVS